jgi:hypothetical protein
VIGDGLVAGVTGEVLFTAAESECDYVLSGIIMHTAGFAVNLNSPQWDFEPVDERRLSHDM